MVMGLFVAKVVGVKVGSSVSVSDGDREGTLDREGALEIVGARVGSTGIIWADTIVVVVVVVVSADTKTKTRTNRTRVAIVNDNGRDLSVAANRMVGYGLRKA
jgi:hypothetical protein